MDYVGVSTLHVFAPRSSNKFDARLHGRALSAALRYHNDMYIIPHKPGGFRRPASIFLPSCGLVVFLKFPYIHLYVMINLYVHAAGPTSSSRCHKITRLNVSIRRFETRATENSLLVRCISFFIQ